MPLSIEVDLVLEIDGHIAKLTGSGRRLRLVLTKTRTLRNMLRVSLPDLPLFGPTKAAPKDFPSLLARHGLTLEIADSKGPLLVLGEDANGKSYVIPGLGTVNDVALASLQAAARLAFNY